METNERISIGASSLRMEYHKRSAVAATVPHMTMALPVRRGTGSIKPLGFDLLYKTFSRPNERCDSGLSLNILK